MSTTNHMGGYRERWRVGARARLGGLTAALLLALLSLVGGPVMAAPDSGPKFDRPVSGSIVLCGEGLVPNVVLGTVLRMRPVSAMDLVVVSTAGELLVSSDRWKALGANRVQVIHPNATLDEAATLALLSAGAVWIEDAGALADSAVLRAHLRSVLARGGVVASAGAGTAAVVGGAAALLPFSKITLLGVSAEGVAPVLPPGILEFTVSPSTAVVIRRRRRVGAVGAGKVRVGLARVNHKAPQHAEFEAVASLGFAGTVPYELDLLAWQRRAREQRKAPEHPSVVRPVLKAGTIVASGGGSVDDATFRRFIAAAGGERALMVCLPSAGTFDSTRAPRSYGARRLQELDCGNVIVLNVTDPYAADTDVRIHRMLGKAMGVWIDGGRTFRFMDAFERTRAAELIADVLRRGGAVGGSSAGCQVLGEVLVRGNPHTNQDMLFGGYTRGLGLLSGTVFDAHFRQRDRQEPFQALVKQMPRMLGIGVDEDTSLVIEGSIAEVMGSEAVTFYDMRPPEAGQARGLPEVILRLGERYDLRTGQRAGKAPLAEVDSESSTQDEEEKTGACKVDLTVVAHLSDIVSNALMLGLRLDEEPVTAFLNNAQKEYDDAGAFLEAVCVHFKVERSKLDALVREYHHCNCTHGPLDEEPGGAK